MISTEVRRNEIRLVRSGALRYARHWSDESGGKEEEDLPGVQDWQLSSDQWPSVQVRGNRQFQVEVAIAPLSTFTNVPRSKAIS